MKKIQDILKRKISRGVRADIKALDEKTIARVFLEAAKEEIKNLEYSDILDIKIKDKILYIKTAHPVISSELFLRRENILDRGNKIAGGKVVEKIII
ncbi:MAG: DciA family protein [Candidatus Moranbacteria bacterium]|nr:DciA family protein [Candidatus Moranbacteria bacterium]